MIFHALDAEVDESEGSVQFAGDPDVVIGKDGPVRLGPANVGPSREREDFLAYVYAVYIKHEGEVLASRFSALNALRIGREFCRQEQAGPAHSAFEGNLL